MLDLIKRIAELWNLPLDDGWGGVHYDEDGEPMTYIELSASLSPSSLARRRNS